MSRPAPSRSLLRPADLIDHVTHITPEFLADRGLHGLLLDLDNTLVPYGSYDEAGVSQTLTWVRDLKLAGVGLYLLSNATGQRAAFWLDRLEFQGVGLAGKPNPRAFHKALRALNLPPALHAKSVHAADVAFVGAFNSILMIGAIVAIVGALAGLALTRSSAFVQGGESRAPEPANSAPDVA